jgi:hypothetical protein
MSFLEHKYDAVIVLDALKTFVTTKQKDEEDLVDYTRQFKSIRHVLESHVGGKLKFAKMAKSDANWDAFDPDLQDKFYKRSYNRFISMLYIQNSDQTK